MCKREILSSIIITNIVTDSISISWLHQVAYIQCIQVAVNQIYCFECLGEYLSEFLMLIMLKKLQIL